MAFALILSVGYGGNLRGLLLAPEYNSPIDTMEEIVEGELPWTMVLYGMELDTHLSTTEDEIEQR